MNNSLNRQTSPAPQSPRPTMSQRNRSRSTSPFLVTLCIMLTVCLFFSVALNLHFILRPDSSPATTDTKKPETSATTEAASKTETESDTETETETATDTETEEETEEEPETTNKDSKDPASESIVFGDIDGKLDAEEKEIFADLIDLLKEENRPLHYEKVTEEESDKEDPTEDTDETEETTAVTDETTGETEEDSETPEEKVVTSPATLGIAYIDIESGRSFTFNGDEKMFTASLIKLPVVYAILQEVEAYESDPENRDKQGKLVYTEETEKYNLSRKWVYDSKTMFVEGTGQIQTKESGFTLTYLELMEYAIKHSDNIAFKEIRRIFGYDSYYALADELQVDADPYSFMTLSAGDLVKFLPEIYRYIETDSRYAQVLKDAMLSITYSVMISPGVSPLKCAHKYGWDIASYHDMGIVYDEAPFALVIMTDLDRGTVTDYTYMQSIAREVLKIHQSFAADDKE